jgi:hypothetical protein
LVTLDDEQSPFINTATREAALEGEGCLLIKKYNDLSMNTKV